MGRKDFEQVISVWWDTGVIRLELQSECTKKDSALSLSLSSDQLAAIAASMELSFSIK